MDSREEYRDRPITEGSPPAVGQTPQPSIQQPDGPPLKGSEEAIRTPERKSRIIRWVALALFLGVIALLALPKLGLGGDEEAGGAPGGGGGGGRGGPGGGAPTKVTAHIVEVGSGSTPVILAGTVLPNEQVDITSEVSGKVVAINFSEGARVGRGSVLARLNDAELRASLSRAESRLKLAELNQKRQEALLAREAVSPAEYEIAVSELEVARAEIELLKAQIEKTVIRAPFSGRIGLRQISVGAYVSPATVIATLQDLDPLKIEFAIPETYAARVSRGMLFHYTIDGSDVRRSARVYAIEPALDASNRTLTVRALSPNSGSNIMPGQFAAVEMLTGRREPLPLVPTQAIIPTMDGEQVYVVAGGTATIRPVKTGARSESFIEIVEGLAPGDTVIVEGIQTIEEGSPVIPLIQ